MHNIIKISKKHIQAGSARRLKFTQQEEAKTLKQSQETRAEQFFQDSITTPVLHTVRRMMFLEQLMAATALKTFQDQAAVTLAAIYEKLNKVEDDYDQAVRLMSGSYSVQSI